MITKSEIFTQYNKARSAAKHGKLDAGRVNRALGIAQSKSPQKYVTTIKTCTCEDHKRHSTPCKHMIAKMIEVKIERTHVKPVVVEPKIIYCEFEYASTSPWEIKMNFWDASNCKISTGKGLVQIDSEKLSDQLQDYEVKKTEYIKKNSWGTHSFKMWWEKK